LAKSLLKVLSFVGLSTGGVTVRVDVEGGKIIRIRPLHYDWKYDVEELPSWAIEARGKVFKPSAKELPPPFSIAYKQRVYSPNRVRYPLKRVDWDPDGERHPENRGKSSYVRITWEEAIDIIVRELKRIIEKYGSYAILVQDDGHSQTKTFHGPHEMIPSLLQHVGGCTWQIRNPDSWEGWWWGAKHVWGMEVAGMEESTNVLLDILENTEVMLCWGCDFETTSWGFGDQGRGLWGFWFKEAGIQQIYICPDLNYGAAVHADKWVPIRPNTDAALQLAIAYVWITEDLYDEEYVATHTVGFEKFKDYVLGREDGVPKTPKWAEEITGVPARIIKALARLWATKRTTIMHHYGGGMIRGAYSTEPARLEVALLAMQGIGKPGRHQLHGAFLQSSLIVHPVDLWSKIQEAIIKYSRCRAPSYSLVAIRNHDEFKKLFKQFIPRVLVPEAVLNPPIEWYSHTWVACPTECQFEKHKYPAEGCPEIRMIWSSCCCWLTCWNGGYKMAEAFRSPKIEFILAQSPWLENDALFADIILPVTTPLEEDDVVFVQWPKNTQFNALIFSPKCIEPIGESKSDYEICCLIAEKLGPALGIPDLLDKFTGGKRNFDEWLRAFFEETGVSKYISFEEWKEKGYWLLPVDPNWKLQKPYMSFFAEDPDSFPLKTPSGKIEFYSERLAELGDPERPPIPKYIPYGETWWESLQHPRAKKYPFLLVSNHPRWRMHAQLDDVAWFHEIPTCKVRGPDGYLYEPIWINRRDAEKLGIKTGDIVMVYNERGAVLAGAYVTERIMPGVVSIDHGARADIVSLEDRIDRGGAINLIAPKEEGKTAALMVVSGYLVNIKKVDLEELKAKYPEALQKPYNKAFGLCYERYVKDSS